MSDKAKGPRLVVDAAAAEGRAPAADPVVAAATPAERAPVATAPQAAAIAEAPSGMPSGDREAIPRQDLEPGTHPIVLIAARGMLQIILVFAVLAGAVWGMRWLMDSRAERPQRPARERVYTVTTVAVQKADHQPQFLVYGTIIAGRTVDLRALVAGEIVTVHPDLRAGRTIEKGAVLVQIDAFAYEGAVTEARANLREAEARLKEGEARIASEKSALERTREQLVLAERDLERSRQLLGSGSGTKKTVEDRQMTLSKSAQAVEQRQANLAIERAKAEQQRAAIERLQWKLAQAERDLADTALKAPFTGVVQSENAGIGRNVGANDILVSLYDEAAVEVRFVVSDNQFGRLANDADGVIGRPVEIAWIVGDMPILYDGVIDRVGAEIRSERGGVELYATVGARQGVSVLRPGAFVEVRVPDQTYTQTIRLPETAVYGGSYVFVVEEGRMRRRDVTIAAFTGNDVLIADGLVGGESVLTTQIADARDGLKVVEEGAAGERQAGKADGQQGRSAPAH
ncbi:MAG TPA: efflux RND transporter periplasmic adaptor subunit [Afifellaceae bacterium]|nr:efflux RND transporter periplasmic adaptor subunit [Afifellaceae bacterium]